MTKDELSEILAKHKLWVESAGFSGAGAYLADANLTGANLAGADLTHANLARANLIDANLAHANLAGANLTDANLTRANLTGAYLAGAYLAGAYLTDANLARANLTRANLADAYLTGANLTGANLAGAYLADANLARANLTGANLAGANLARANLAGANLAGADLARADLAGADLAGADLADAFGLAPERVQPLLMLLDQPGAIRAYKLVDKDGNSPLSRYGKLHYAIGEVVRVAEANISVNADCGAGVNVATLDWCLRWWKPGCRVLIVEFEAADIAAIPTASDGKFRVHRCRVVGEKHLDVVALGLVAPQPDAEAGS